MHDGENESHDTSKSGGAIKNARKAFFAEKKKSVVAKAQKCQLSY